MGAASREFNAGLLATRNEARGVPAIATPVGFPDGGLSGALEGGAPVQGADEFRAAALAAVRDVLQFEVLRERLGGLKRHPLEAIGAGDEERGKRASGGAHESSFAL
jgi:hypothetical protein